MNHNPELLIRFFPLMPNWLMIALIALAAILSIYAIVKGARGWIWRVSALTLFLLMLANPSLVEEIRETKPDTVLVVVDQSTSNQINNRDAETEKIRREIENKLGEAENINYRVITVADNPEDQGGTMLFGAIARGLSDIPKTHLGAVVLITDGQIHDVPVGQNELNGVPFHALLTGSPGEHDRRLKIIRSPGFGIVGQPQKITVHIEDDLNAESTVMLSLRSDGDVVQNQAIPAGRDVEIPLTINHAGPNIFELSIPKGASELSDENNHAVVTVNGVRDRLRVLLISGDPHPGTRVWRNFLKSDPSVDLVHFTILRPPEKQDSIPTEELSLIAFPTKELFEDKLYDFNLIIFDRYRRLSVLPNEYMLNIVEFVEKGGAVLDAEGPVPDVSLSLFDTPVGTILPTATAQKTIDAEFVPTLTGDGLRHPVTSGLPGLSKDNKTSKWGPWLRQMDAQIRRGTVIMDGAGNRPLLVLDRVGQGRVAQLFSDQIWLWARGYAGGGPHSELLRRLSHWLMKEPQLEENDLSAEVQGHTISITQRSLMQSDNNIVLTKPGNETEQVTLTEESPGLARTKINVTKTGVYRIANNKQTIMVGVGGLNPLEYSDLRSSKDKLNNFVESTNGSIRWISEDGIPDIRHLEGNRSLSGHRWIGVKKNNNYSITGIKQTAVIPPLAYLLLGSILLLLAWRKEGK
ncbi:MAG: hypothetical protein EYC62_05180 [Alphaproteobacteria bacterium]|nr:MAG: hypothetical protein EYC62_05180 [Alphaproteobacteria bacterium]